MHSAFYLFLFVYFYFYILKPNLFDLICWFLVLSTCQQKTYPNTNITKHSNLLSYQSSNKLLFTCILFLHLLHQSVVTTQTPNMVMASLGVSQAIFFSNTNTTATPSRFNLLPNKPPTHLLGSPFSLQTNPSSISIFSRRNRTHLFRCTPNSNNTSLNWDWNRWCRHFSDIEQAETFASLLKVTTQHAFFLFTPFILILIILLYAFFCQILEHKNCPFLLLNFAT